MSKPTTLQGRVIVLDPYDEAVWINVSVFGGAAESGLSGRRFTRARTSSFMQTRVRGKNSRRWAVPMRDRLPRRKCRPSSTTDLIEFVATEPEQNHRVISSVKKLPEVAGAMGKPLSISGLRLKECAGKSEIEAGCAAAKQGLNTSPKSPDGAAYPCSMMCCSQVESPSLA